jgi:hypothetical protein
MSTCTITVNMDYPGWSISKNGLWKGGNRRWGMNDEAKRWKRNLADAVKLSLIATEVFEPKPPVHVEVGGRFFDGNNAPDLHNLLELVMDSVQEGTGINDKHFSSTVTAPVIVQAMPEIVVKVTVTVEEAAA